jgi:hypothetical protein
VTDIEDQLTVAAGRPVGEVPAQFVRVHPGLRRRPSHIAIRAHQHALRGVLTHWFGI